MKSLKIGGHNLWPPILGHGGRCYMPYAFTEQGVYTLATILNILYFNSMIIKKMI